MFSDQSGWIWRCLDIESECQMFVFLVSFRSVRLFLFALVPPYIRCPYPMVGQAVSFMVDIYVECYVHGYPPPRISWSVGMMTEGER